MAKNGFKILDSDMHVFEPHDLYLKYMDPKWGDRIPRGELRKKHGQIKFTFADGKPLRPSGTQVLAATSLKPIAGETSPGETEVAHRYEKPLQRDYDACPNWKRWTKRVWMWRFCSELFRCTATIALKRSMPTIFAVLGTVGWRIFARRILNDSNRQL